MVGIIEIRDMFFQLMDDECKSVILSPSTDDEIESHTFMLKEHAQAIRETCTKGDYTVSFRMAGESTLKLIRNGNPCKGHDIFDKSIKKRDIKWNYTGQDTILRSLEGCIGFSLNDQLNELHGVWVESDNKPQRCHLTEAHNHTNKCYTGDYDMHDLLKYHDAKLVQIHPETSEENAAIDHFNMCLLTASAHGVQLNEIDNRYSKLKLFMDANESKCSKHSGYSLIRHGAQTSYWFYLHCEESRTELEKILANGTVHDFIWKNNIISISPPICFFNNKGEAYILKNIYQIYRYYKENGILDHIPFIYFFQPLQEVYNNDHKFSSELRRHSEVITKWAKEYFM